MKKLLRVLAGEKFETPPIWMMRQAGRYLPEYRQVREQAGSFLNLCANPVLAAEVTLQPIRRFGFDAAILFSDILVVPQALGRSLRFEEGKGPLMEPLAAADIAALAAAEALACLAPVFETVERVKAELPSETALIGFCGAPWTVATYMIAGHATPDQAPARLFAYRQPQEFAALMDLLADISADYLIKQLEAGADCVQIFDSWAGVLDAQSFELACIAPVRRMIGKIRARFPQAPIIAFPRGAGALYRDYAAKTRATAIGLDWTVPLDFAAQLQQQTPIQGNLDPMRLLAGGEALRQGVAAIMQSLQNRPFIFNLGHGITPETPIENVEIMLKLVRSGEYA